MPMSNETGADPSVVDLPLSDPNCVSAGDACIAFYQAHNASQATTPWTAQFYYGHYITWYYLVAILLVILARLFLLARQHRVKCESSEIPNLIDKCLAFFRSIAYPRRLKCLSQYIQLPPAGILFFLAITVLYTLLLTFIAHPYLRPHRSYGSPPLAVRTGLMAIALTPLIFATAGKVNPITILTGVSYEKLNIYHRWVSWICFGLSVVHTGPFIAAPLIDGGYEALHNQWRKAGSYEVRKTSQQLFNIKKYLFFLAVYRHSFDVCTILSCGMLSPMDPKTFLRNVCFYSYNGSHCLLWTYVLARWSRRRLLGILVGKPFHLDVWPFRSRYHQTEDFESIQISVIWLSFHSNKLVRWHGTSGCYCTGYTQVESRATRFPPIPKTLTMAMSSFHRR